MGADEAYLGGLGERPPKRSGTSRPPWSGCVPRSSPRSRRSPTASRSATCNTKKPRRPALRDRRRRRPGPWTTPGRSRIAQNLMPRAEGQPAASAVPPARPASSRRPVRREGAEHYLFLTLISFAGTVIATRSFLELTGYPRIGGGELHIAHALLWRDPALRRIPPAVGSLRTLRLPCDGSAGWHRYRPLHRRGREAHHQPEQLLLPCGGSDHLRDLPAGGVRLGYEPGAGPMPTLAASC